MGEYFGLGNSEIKHSMLAIATYDIDLVAEVPGVATTYFIPSPYRYQRTKNTKTGRTRVPNADGRLQVKPKCNESPSYPGNKTQKTETICFSAHDLNR